uniref:Immunoglobulin V-set domain-containing protein n=1 Tax=Chrysemys picta bellii TaxID=8478 RepID=A0A8C3EYL4_CHRPI
TGHHLLQEAPSTGSAAQETRYQITQPVSLSAPARGSVTLPCAFTYPREIEPLRDVQIYWRWGGFHGKFIYNHTEGFTHPDYGGRIILVGDPRGSRTASIRIDWLWESDASEYVCHVRVQKQDNEWEQWRSVPGINLTVTERAVTGHRYPTSRGKGGSPIPGGSGGKQGPPISRGQRGLGLTPLANHTSHQQFPQTLQFPSIPTVPLVMGTNG